MNITSKGGVRGGAAETSTCLFHHPLLTYFTCHKSLILFYLGDSDEGRARNFRLDLERFFRLDSPLSPFPKENTNRVQREESIDICGTRFNELRKLLTKQGKSTARWIRDELLKSEDILVGGRNHFIQLLDT